MFSVSLHEIASACGLAMTSETERSNLLWGSYHYVLCSLHEIASACGLAMTCFNGGLAMTCPMHVSSRLMKKTVYSVMKKSYTYLMSNKNNTVIYAGVTSNIIKRVWQHKNKVYKGFTSKYNCDKLVFYREFTDIREAIAYEKKLKAGSRAAKEKLINEMNPDWKNLSEGWIFNFE